MDGRVVELGGGARVIFEEELPSEAELTVGRSHAPDAPADLVALTDPVKLELAGAEFTGATLEFPLPDVSLADADAVMVATYDETLGEWVPVTSQYDASAGVVRAYTTHFSWWAPWTWDWAGIGATVNQAVGEVIGKRSGQATCSRGQATPDWVAQVVGVSNDPALAIRSCAEGEGGVLAVEIVNNRPYGQVLTYGSAVKWGWHETGSSYADAGRNEFMDGMLGGDRLYLPPNGRASVGILEPAAGSMVSFHIGVTPETILGDVISVVGQDVMGAIGSQMYGPVLGECSAYLATVVPPEDLGSVDALGQLVTGAADCLQRSVVSAAGQGLLDDVSVAKLESTLGAIKGANRVGMYLKAYDVEWKLLDLWVDQKIVGGVGEFGNGFSVRTASEAVEEPVELEAKLPESATGLRIYDDVKISTREDMYQISDTPPSFQEYILSMLAGEPSTCPSGRNIWVRQYHSAGFAELGMDECGGYVSFVKKIDGKWVEIIATQDVIRCEDLEAHRIPSGMVSECW
ncbi:MAG: hypothetical protein EOL89_02770 [Actinobacteria bacterium]|nr:hypothetical protein [Actinomycetota bacterium]